jgi:hypothetical protein
MELKQSILGSGDEIVFIEKNFFDNKNLEIEDRLLVYCYHYVIGKFADRFNINILKPEEVHSLNNNDSVIMIVSLEDNNKFNFPGFDESIVINRGGIAVFKNIISYEVEKEYKLFEFNTEPGKKIWGQGATKYDVTCLVQDIYKISVMADSEEEAKKIADEVNISYWDHPAYGPEGKYKILKRHAKWGNYTVKVNDFKKDVK